MGLGLEFEGAVLKGVLFDLDILLFKSVDKGGGETTEDETFTVGVFNLNN
jgi:hypothetical protein